MARLLTILSLIFAVLLFPPAALALISNNAVLGDATYPIKRGLEGIIYSIASINPTTKAWFSAARSDRRFNEISVLVIEGKKADETLNELVEQTQAAATQINQVENKTQKQELIKQLTKSIEKYDKGLASLPTIVPTTQTTVQPTTEVTPIPTSTQRPTVTPRSTTTPRPGPIINPTPTSTLTPTLTPSPTPSPTPIPGVEPSPCDQISDPIQKARCELQRIRGGLGAKVFDEKGKDKEEDKKSENEKEKKSTKEENSNLTPLKEAPSGSKVRSDK